MNDEHYISFKEELMGSNYEKVRSEHILVLPNKVMVISF